MAKLTVVAVVERKPRLQRHKPLLAATKPQICSKFGAFLAAVAKAPHSNEIWSFLVAVAVAVAKAPNFSKVWSFLVKFGAF